MLLALDVANSPSGLLRVLQSHLSGSGPASVLFTSLLGLVLGMRHSTDADHVVALSTIVSQQRSVRKAALIGSLWGLGHTVTIFAIGSLIILFNVHIPTRLGLSMEFSVAVMLVLLGILNLTGVMQWLMRRLPHGPHLANLQTPQNPGNSLGAFQLIRPFVIGLVHGLAGSAAVALLVLSTIRSPVWATVYLIIFGLGTMGGMMMMTTGMAIPLAYGSRRFARLNTHLVTASGLISLAFGSFLVYQLGFVAGLFSRNPHWTPQ